MADTTINGVLIKKLENAGFMIKSDDMVVYIDPNGLGDVHIPEKEMADIILITNEYFGHCDPDSIKKVRKSDCTTLIPEQMSLHFRGDARRVMDGDSLADELSIKGVDIEVLPAYDSCETALAPGKGVGYFFLFGGLGIYHAGHTCDIADLKGLSPDVLMLPVGDHVMDIEKAANAVSMFGSVYVIPMFYGLDSTGCPMFTNIVREKNPSAEVILL
ncbi:MBL fold metallo-hydrolase [Methanolobus bombayensis]|uniref:MBL fold metallo-hydrolase n=1 Tax=Methanolobus bombayensis TaxID=38023 RepID=UPI001AE80B9D|nr:MBL fold metallo-hydrolase [Methanolobus bombayensis]MBP1910059.1 L-ascorbate metabolism protein UlaG (beta-lactamase superfamily) [Methanolobus bombayensis]